MHEFITHDTISRHADWRAAISDAIEIEADDDTEEEQANVDDVFEVMGGGQDGGPG